MIKKILVIVVALSYSQVFAAKWLDIGAGADLSQNYLDTDSVTHPVNDDETTLAWIKQIYKYPAKSPASSKRASMRKMLFKFDCTQKKYGPMQLIDYDENQTLIFIMEQQNIQKTQLLLPAPDSLAKNWLTMACVFGDMTLAPTIPIP